MCCLVQTLTRAPTFCVTIAIPATQLQRLAELVLGAAALCEDNAEYVRTIMEMAPEQQRCLVPIIEQAMAASSTAMSGGASRPMRSGAPAPQRTHPVSVHDCCCRHTARDARGTRNRLGPSRHLGVRRASHRLFPEHAVRRHG